ncbi:MAG TPA: hypothetical protein VFX23_01165 [Limnobacter sp.]|uniref:hypothetical protein n=1 Tax=Limnobacter sp. TaxID=2003368 RepID=UPI002E2F0377|nr:hypothetical protein [Limnobacter sp.]HEX5484579.1 hypothetical protein [Limnobacter sp.]
MIIIVYSCTELIKKFSKQGLRALRLLILTIGTMLMLISCQWMAELSTPGGGGIFNGLSPKQSVTDYTQIVQYIQKSGFAEVNTKNPESAYPLNSLYSGKPSGYFKDYIFHEESNPYVISLQIDMNSSLTSISYQFGEYRIVDANHMRARKDLNISSEGCRVTTLIDSYILTQLGENHRTYNGSPQCESTINGVSAVGRISGA